MKSAALRAQVESMLGPGFPSPFTLREPYGPEMVSWGLWEIDSITGGLPRGGLTEICGPASSGRTSLMLSILAEITAREEVCAWVDASDAFEPHSAKAAGVELERLLWVRCRNVEQALQAADLLLQGGGFGVVALDLGDVAPQTARRVPLSSWFRFQRAVEHTPTVLILLEQEPNAKTCASLVLRLEVTSVLWSAAVDEFRNSKLSFSQLPCQPPGRFTPAPHSYLLRGARLSVEVVRSRNSKIEIRKSKFEIS